MLSFDIASPSANALSKAGAEPSGQVAGLAARILAGFGGLRAALSRHRSEMLPSLGGRNLLRDDLGLPPLDRDGLPL
jgi:hypothetical protein